MCIIAYKPIDVNFPTNETLKTCFENNPDGAGFMYPSEDGVHIHKGFMTFNEFNKALAPLKKKNLPVVMHFRITTHGGTSPEMTQPFPCTSKTKKLKKLVSLSRVGIAHNGIIDMTRDAKSISDTALFIKRYASFLIKDSEYYRDERIARMIEEMIGSKMAILSKDGHVEILGKGWTHTDDGMWYSNTSYEPWDWKSYYKGYNSKDKNCYGYYDWDDWYDEMGKDWYDPKESDTYKDLSGELSEQEAEDWMIWRDECQDRIDSQGMACYGCPYENECHAM